MKKMLLIFLLLTFSIANSFGQRLGLNAGYNYSSPKLSSDIFSIDDYFIQEKPISGFFIGATYEIPISFVIFIEPGLNFSSKGYHSERPIDEIGEPLLYESTTRLYYLDLPIILKAKWSIGKTKVFVGVGPYYSYGLFVSYKLDGEKYNRDFDELGLKRFDGGLNFTGGAEFGNFHVRASYQFGLLDINQADFMKRKNRLASLSVGYRFNKRSK